MQTAPEPIDAATVVVAREAEHGIELLMLRRQSKVHFGGMWVFPGGRVEPDDRNSASSDIEAFKAAAVREAEEETGLVLSADSLSHFAHWLPAPGRSVRYSTQFFFAAAPASDPRIEVDESEIVEHQWMTPIQVLRQREAGEMHMVTPTFVTVYRLTQFGSLSAACQSIGEPQKFHTRSAQVEGGMIAVYHGDIAYEDLDFAKPGPRRRANMLDTKWWWEEHDGQGVGPWPQPIDI